ncbi:hypothetical protein [Sporichthya sp.]|uniref:hypothetical protein n=1 Tax=Sporichthya sp. TaxID=65475 RepID=UPI0017B02FF0|nr:hypothetical protein [Sporichthya sp.]MBA3743518.1 hypothetical protein [Sporichthya sp.]
MPAFKGVPEGVFQRALYMTAEFTPTLTRSSSADQLIGESPSEARGRARRARQLARMAPA